MTDRYTALTVVLDRDIRSDDAEQLINAIKALRHVISVTPNVSEHTDHVAYMRARCDLETKLWAALRENPVK